MDFTSVAINALKYGISFFKNAKFTIVHASFTVGKNPELFGSKPGVSNSDFLQSELENLILHELDLKALPENITIKVEMGDPSEVIRNEAKTNHYDSIMMGTRDKYSFFDKWIGTISLSLVKTVDTPIYLIPRYAKHQSIKNVIIASESSTSTKFNLDKIANWNKDHIANLTFLHIKKNENDALATEFYQNIKYYFEKRELDFDFDISEIQGENVCKSILAKSYNMQADMIMILPDKQNFLNALIINSISKEMILSSDIPMLFYKS